MIERRASIGARRNPESEAAILDAAAALIAENGLKGLTMEAVARRARAGKATLYRWWPTRGALLLAVYQRQRRPEPMLDTGTLESDLMRALEVLFKAWSGNSGTLFRLIIASAQDDDDLAEALSEYRLERLAALIEIFERAAARGELARDAPPVRDMAQAIMAMAWLRLLTDDRDSDAKSIVGCLLQGWKSA